MIIMSSTREYQKTNEVCLLCPAVPGGRHRKFHRPWVGPYIVMKKISDVVYRIQKKGSRKRRVVHVHVNRLKPFFRPIMDEENVLKEKVGIQDRVDQIPREHQKRKMR